MKTSVVKAVHAVLRQMEETPGALATESKVRSWLARQGFNKRDIEAAIKLMSTRLAGSLSVESSGPRAIRQFAPFEYARLSADARSALMRLEMNDLIDPMEREMIIERLLHHEGDMDMEALDYLLSAVFGAMRNVEAQNAMFSTLEGFGPTVH